MNNEDIAKELLSVLKERMMYREGLPSDGWAIEKICDALATAQQSEQEDLLPCGHSSDSLGGFGGCNPNGSCVECEASKI